MISTAPVINLIVCLLPSKDEHLPVSVCVITLRQDFLRSSGASSSLHKSSHPFSKFQFSRPSPRPSVGISVQAPEIQCGSPEPSLESPAPSSVASEAGHFNIG